MAYSLYNHLSFHTKIHSVPERLHNDTDVNALADTHHYDCWVSICTTGDIFSWGLNFDTKYQTSNFFLLGNDWYEMEKNRKQWADLDFG